MADGARTHDNRNHNPGLYQLSYSHHQKSFYYLICTNYVFVITTVKQIINGVPDRDRTCNPQLRRLVLYPIELRAQSSRAYPYQRIVIGRGGEIRTPDILVPNQARYQATLHPGKDDTIPILGGNVNFHLIKMNNNFTALMIFFMLIGFIFNFLATPLFYFQEETTRILNTMNINCKKINFMVIIAGYITWVGRKK